MKLPPGLPLGPLEELAMAFDRLDSVCCWLARKHLAMTLSSLLSLSGVTLRQFLQLRSVAPEVIICNRATGLTPDVGGGSGSAGLSLQAARAAAICSSDSEEGVSAEEDAPAPLAASGAPAYSPAIKAAMSLTEVLLNPPGGAAARVKQRAGAVRQGLLARVAVFHSKWAAEQPHALEVEKVPDEEAVAAPGKGKKQRGKRRPDAAVEDATTSPEGSASSAASPGAPDEALVVSPHDWDVQKRKAWHPSFPLAGLVTAPVPLSAALPGWSAEELAEALACSTDASAAAPESALSDAPLLSTAAVEVEAVAASQAASRVPMSAQKQKSYDGESTFYRHAATFGSLARALNAAPSAPSGGASDALASSSSPLPPPLPPCSWDTIELYLEQCPHYAGQIVSSTALPAKPPSFVSATAGALSRLHPDLRAALLYRGIPRLYAHQDAAVNAALDGQDVVISTSTSSGKSLTFLLPIFQRALATSATAPSTALLLFPTKALAQDQLLAIRRYLAASASLSAAVRPATLDGDATQLERAGMRQDATLLLANPDILHAHVLPGHKQWARVLSSLAFIVLDEAHVYRGAFGAHVSLVLRRLLRLCHRVYGSSPQIICCSATIGNPLGMFHALVPDVAGPAAGAEEAGSAPAAGDRRRGPVALVRADADSSGCGRRKFIVWNPPFIDKLRREGAVNEEGSGAGAAGEDESSTSAPPQVAVIGGDEDAPAYPLDDAVAAADVAAAARDEAALYPVPKPDVPKGGSKRGAGGAQRSRKRALPALQEADTEAAAAVAAVAGEGEKTSGKPRPAKRRRVAAAVVDTDDDEEEAAAGVVEPVPLPASPAAPAAPETTSPRGSPRDNVPALLDAVGSAMVAPRDWAALLGYSATAALRAASGTGATSSGGGQSQSSSVPKRDVTSAFALASARKAVPSLRDPLNYRRSAFAAPYGLEAAAAAGGAGAGRELVVPKWVQRWVATRGGSDAHSRSSSRNSPNVMEGSSRRSALVETANLLTMLVAGGMKTLVFCRVRKVAELLLQYTHERLAAIDDVAAAEATAAAPHRPLRPRVKAYRAGYLVEHRRAIEAELFTGQLLGVVATNALELGVDIGALDAVVLLGYPPSVSSFWQQTGRAGRGGKDAVTLLVTYDCPVDQHFARHPDELLTRAPECVFVDAGGNTKLLKMHTLAAGAETPLVAADVAYFSTALGGVLRELREKQSLVPLPGAGQASASAGGSRPPLAAFITPSWVGSPAARFSLRSMDDVVYRVWDVSRRPADGPEQPGVLVDEIEEHRAWWEIHPGAVYMNQGGSYRVVALDTATKQAHVVPCAEPYYTGVRDLTDVNAQQRLASGSGSLANVHLGRAQVSTIVYGFRKFWKRSGQPFEECDLHLPPLDTTTLALWADVTLDVKRALDGAGLCYLGGCHGAGHALMAVLPLFVACDRADLGTECPAPMQTRNRPLRFIVYDTHAGGGSGLLPGAFPRISDILQAALALVTDCDCKDGCPRCIYDGSCKEFNYVLDKAATMVVLTAALGRPIDALLAKAGGAGAAGP